MNKTEVDGSAPGLKDPKTRSNLLKIIADRPTITDKAIIIAKSGKAVNSVLYFLPDLKHS